MLVEEVMTKNILKIDCKKTVYDACKFIVENKVGSLVVVDKDIICGIVTERDLVEKVILKKRESAKTLIIDVMTPNLKTVHALAPIEKAAKIMKENNIKKLPVVLNNELVGIITETDLSRTIDAFSDAIEELYRFYIDSKENIEQIIEDWGNIIINLKGYKRLIFSKKEKTVEEIKK